MKIMLYLCPAERVSPGSACPDLKGVNKTSTAFSCVSLISTTQKHLFTDLAYEKKKCLVKSVKARRKYLSISFTE